MTSVISWGLLVLLFFSLFKLGCTEIRCIWHCPQWPSLSLFIFCQYFLSVFWANDAYWWLWINQCPGLANWCCGEIEMSCITVAVINSCHCAPVICKAQSWRLLCWSSLLRSDQIINLCCIQAEVCFMHILKVYVVLLSEVSTRIVLKDHYCGIDPALYFCYNRLQWALQLWPCNTEPLKNHP